jgi:porin
MKKSTRRPGGSFTSWPWEPAGHTMSAMTWSQFICVLVAAAVLYQSETAQAEEQPSSTLETANPHDSGVNAAVDSRLKGQAPDDIDRKLERREQPKESKYPATALDPAVDRWQSLTTDLETEYGLQLGIAYTTLYQRLTDKKDGENIPIEGAGGDLDIYGDWSLPGPERSWSVGFQAEMRHRLLTSASPSELGASAGSQWGTTTGFNTQDMSLIQLWWQQTLFDETLRYRIGEVDPGDFFDVGTMDSANLFFINAALADNLTMALPENGVGAVVHISPSDNWYLNVGISDANGRRTDMDFNNAFDDNDQFIAAEIGWTPDIQGYGQGYYQLTVWETDGRRQPNQSSQSSGDGYALRLEQFFGEEFLSFATYSKSSGKASSVRQLATVGIGMLDILGYQEDIVGVAVGWGEPRDGNLRDQYVAEVFYRMQITDYLQVTPDLQIIKNPSQNRSDDTIGVIGLRLRLDF